MSEQTFRRELERRAEDVQPRHFGFEDVRTTAYRIRRRRRLAASVAAAAVVAAVLLVPGMIGGSPRSEGPEPAPSPTTAVPTTVGTSVLHDGTLTHPDGSTVPLDVDAADVQQLGVLTDGRIVVAVSNSRIVRVYGSNGTLESEHDVAINQITMSADDTLAAWLDENTRVVVLESGVTEPITYEWGIPMPGEGVGSVDAVYGSDCAHDGCTVLGGDGTTTTSKLSLLSEPATDLGTSEPLRVAAASPDGAQWAVSFPAADGEQFGCSGVYSPATGLVDARTCVTTYWQFSPDGTHVTGARGDNGMWGSVEVIEWGEGADPVLTYEPDDGFTVKDWAWLDTEHLLVVVAGLDNPSEWSLLRVPIDGGDPETVAGPVDGPNPERASAFVLSD